MKTKNMRTILVSSLVVGTPTRFGAAIAHCANPQARAKFLARTFSKMYILNE